MRLTVKAVGDYSASLSGLRPGTPVMVEGPYGKFTRHAQVWPRAVLVAAGIGVTALRSLLEDLPRKSSPIVVLRASRREDLVLGQEVADLVRNRHGQLHVLVGHREQASIDERSLRWLVPDLDRRDVFVCGPEGFVASIVDLVKSLGVPDEAIHHEAFAL
jgi:ferredoxin-NADP reductase